MTTKERLHQLVDQMAEERAGAWLAAIELDTDSANGHHAEPDEEDIDEVTRLDLERIAAAPPLDENHPLWDMIGMFSSDEPTDMANHKDEYIADAIEHGWR